MSPVRTSTIGPYRLEDRLGAGGMGEVWRAWDGRLDRSVAVKLIRPESAEDQTVRERFRREARAAAALTHPSVVRIYDIIDSGEGDAIVMELVEGELLSKRIARGPLPVEEALRLGRQIAEGLAAAHRRDILHRDLKAENVIVTPDGEAKVLDFGLAKRLSGDGEESLTRSANVVGTFRTMSPEQARGLPLDTRSDLFSFGVLLYEMLTCQSPFKSETALETLQGICAKKQAPVRELRPEVPSTLSLLIDNLLEKDASFRPPSAQVVAARLEAIGEEMRETSAEETTWMPLGVPTEVPRSGPAPIPALPAGKTAPRFGGWKTRTAILCGALLLIAALVLAVQRFRRPPVIYIAVLQPEVTQGRDIPAVDAMAASLEGTLLSGLLSLEEVRPLSAEYVDPISGTLAEIGQATAADEIMTSQLDCDPDVCQVSVQRVDAADGAVIWASKSFSVPLERPHSLAETLQGPLAKAYPDRRPRGDGSWLEVREEDYAEYLRLYHSFDTRREQEFSAGEILDRLDRIRETSPRFLEAWIFESYVLQHRFRAGRDLRDLQRASEVLERAQELAPDDPRPLFSLFEVAFLSEDLVRAESALAALERLQPGDARLLASRARLLDRQGESERALRLMRQATERLPSWRHYFWMADMEYRHGKIEEARADLRKLLHRSPGNVTGKSLLAQLELSKGDLREAAKIYRELVLRSPQVQYLSNLGAAEMLLGNLSQAEQSFRRAVELQPANPFALLNLADVQLLLGDLQEAADLYRETVRLAEADATAGANWQMASVRAQALAHLGRNEEAVEAIQEALRLAAPNNPQVAYEASLVYVLLGEKTSALSNAKQALAQGYEEIWFNLPWFEPLRPALALEGLASERQGSDS